MQVEFNVNIMTTANDLEKRAEQIRKELSIEDKTRKITNLLTYLRQKGEIKNIGTDRKPLWVLSDSNVKPNVNVRENVREVVRVNG